MTGRLDLPSSVLAAPMAGGPTTPELVIAAAEAGSLGFLPTGYRSAEQFADDLARVRAGTTTFGVNLFVPESTPPDGDLVAAYRDAIRDEVEATGADLGPLLLDDDDDWDAKIKLLTRNPAPWVSFTFGLPDTGVVRRLQDAGSRILLTVTDRAEARAAMELAPHGLVVQSSAAGGHRGTFDQRRTPDNEGLPDLLRTVRAVTDVPLVAAGGIGVRADVQAVLLAGAAAAAVGTALLLADEAGTSSTHRAALVDPTSTTTTMRAYTGRVARGIPTAFSDRYDGLAPPAYPAVHHLTAPMRRWAAAHDDRDHLHLWSGTGFRSAREGSTRELLASLQP